MAADAWVRLDGISSTFAGVYIGPIDGVRGRVETHMGEALTWSHTIDGLTYTGTTEAGAVTTIKNVTMYFCDVSPGDAGVFAPADRFITGIEPY